MLLHMFLIWIFFNEYTQFTGQQAKGEAISLTPPYHFRQLHEHLEVSRAIAAKSSPLHIASSWIRTETFGFQAQDANNRLCAHIYIVLT